jgi:hypothetical protein
MKNTDSDFSIIVMCINLLLPFLTYTHSYINNNSICKIIHHNHCANMRLEFSICFHTYNNNNNNNDNKMWGMYNMGMDGCFILFMSSTTEI